MKHSKEFMEEKEKEILTGLIQRQVRILGEDVLADVKRIPEIEIDEDGKVVRIYSEFDKVVVELIKVFSKRNPLAKYTILTSLMFAKVKHPELKVPEAEELKGKVY